MAGLSARLLADDVLGLSGHTWATIAIAAGAIAAVAAATFAAWQVLVSILNERKRTQPVVIAHDAGGRQFGDRGNPNTVLPTYLTNEGGGQAFNVRFGVDFDGVRYAWKFSTEDSDNGSYQRVVRVGKRFPVGAASFNIEIPGRSSRSGETPTRGASTGAVTRTPMGRRGKRGTRWIVQAASTSGGSGCSGGDCGGKNGADARPHRRRGPG